MKKGKILPLIALLGALFLISASIITNFTSSANNSVEIENTTTTESETSDIWNEDLEGEESANQELNDDAEDILPAN